MKIRKDRWHYTFYKFGLQRHSIMNENIQPDFCTYVRVATYDAARVALAIGMRWIVAMLFSIFFIIFCSVFTVVANIATIPLGIGIAMVWYRQELLKVPFLARRPFDGEKVSLAFFVIPIWILVMIFMGFWPGLIDHPSGVVQLLCLLGRFAAVAIVAIIIIIAFLAMFFLFGMGRNSYKEFRMRRKNAAKMEAEGSIADAWRLTKAYVRAKRNRFCPIVEFVDPPAST